MKFQKTNLAMLHTYVFIQNEEKEVPGRIIGFGHSEGDNCYIVLNQAKRQIVMLPMNRKLHVLRDDELAAHQINNDKDNITASTDISSAAMYLVGQLVDVKKDGVQKTLFIHGVALDKGEEYLISLDYKNKMTASYLMNEVTKVYLRDEAREYCLETIDFSLDDELQENDENPFPEKAS